MFAKRSVRAFWVAAFLLTLALAAYSLSTIRADGPIVLQDFEGDVKLFDTYQAKASIGDVAKSGKGSLKSSSDKGEWHTVGAALIKAPVDLSGFGQICFAAYDTTKASNTVGVKLFDTTGAKTERWTDNEGVGTNPKTKQNTWVPMCLNLITYTGIDLKKIEKVEFTMFAAGDYYFDDITAQPRGAAAATAAAPADPAADLELTVVQDFEKADTYYADYQANVSQGDVAKNGKASLKATSDKGEWHAFGAYPSPRPFDASKFDKVCLWIYDTTAQNNGKADNTVGISLIDAAGTKDEVWTDKPAGGANPKTVKDTWVQMCINLSAYTKADLSKIDKIQLAMFYAGTYYVDDIAFGKLKGGAATPAATAAPTAAAVPLTFTVVQDFEKADTFYSDYQADVSLGDIAKNGKGSLKAASDKGEWHAFGAYPSPRPFDASKFDKVCFWMYDTTDKNNGKADNTVGVSLIDKPGVKDEVWTDKPEAGPNSKTVKDTWVQMCINVSAYVKADLTKIDKIQFSMFHPGVYYVDDITFGKAAK